MFWLLLPLIFLFSRPSLAAGSVTITNVSGNIVQGDVFNLSYSLTNFNIGDTYYLKAYGGADASTSQINTFYNNQLLTYGTGWTNFPTVVIGAGNSAVGSLNGEVVNGTGQLNLQLRVALVTNTSGVWSTSPPVVISVVAPSATVTPSPSPTPTPLPTNTPTITPTPSPSNTPTPSLTSTPIATRTPTPTRTVTPTPIQTATPEPTAVFIPTPASFSAADSLNIGDIKITPTAGPDKFSPPSVGLLSLIFIIAGGVLLIIPVVLTRFKS